MNKGCNKNDVFKKDVIVMETTYAPAAFQYESRRRKILQILGDPYAEPVSVYIYKCVGFIQKKHV